MSVEVPRDHPLKNGVLEVVAVLEESFSLLTDTFVAECRLRLRACVTFVP
jgi:hypothetical protein